jgi:splicing factor 3B subunit 1
MQMGLLKPTRIVDRESDYAKRRLNRLISPARNDAIGMGDKTPDVSTRTYADIMREQQFAREQDQTMRNIQRQKEDMERRREEEAKLGALDSRPTAAQLGGSLPPVAPVAPPPAAAAAAAAPTAPTTGKRRNRWDQDAAAAPAADDACVPDSLRSQTATFRITDTSKDYFIVCCRALGVR